MGRCQSLEEIVVLGQPDMGQGGKVDLAASSFLRYDHPPSGAVPPQGHFILGIEEAKAPPPEEEMIPSAN